MGTYWQVDLFGLPGWADHLLQAGIERELERLVAQMSHWRADSDLQRFGRAAAGEWVWLPPELMEVLKAAAQVCRDSEGAFDPAVAAAVDAWGFGPSQLELREAPTQAPVTRGVAGIELDLLNGCARQPGGVLLDLSAIGKGYAVDRIAQILRERGAWTFLVEIGGEFFGQGLKPNGHPWWIAVEEPPGSTNGDGLRIGLSGLSLATSGDYRRFAVLDGVRYSHTIDPATGAPVRHGVASVTVVHELCMLADAYSTAIYVMGAEAGLQWAERKGIAVALRDRTESGHETRYSSQFRRLLEA